jgi:protocatechuate 3,4-dioxygenase beta subunit
VTVQPSDKVVELSTLTLAYPALLSGRLTDPSGTPIADADVDAWLPVIDPASDNGLTGAVIRIATTTTDADGRYTLLLPASISQ